jgi:hypothetical protein
MFRDMSKPGMGGSRIAIGQLFIRAFLCTTPFVSASERPPQHNAVRMAHALREYAVLLVHSNVRISLTGSTNGELHAFSASGLRRCNNGHRGCIAHRGVARCVALAGLVVALEAYAQSRHALLRHLRTVHAQCTHARSQCWGPKGAIGKVGTWEGRAISCARSGKRRWGGGRRWCSRSASGRL